MESKTSSTPVIDVAKQNKIIVGVATLVDICHSNARAKGFWDNPRRVSEMLMLQVMELAEAGEWDRKGNPMSNHIPDHTGIAEELADCIIRICDMAGGQGLDLPSAIVAKLMYNQNREYMHGKIY